MVMRLVTFKLDEKTLEDLDRYAQRKGMSRSDVIRLAIERLIYGRVDGSVEGYVVRPDYGRVKPGRRIHSRWVDYNWRVD